jgi:hypothetical protein
MSIRWLADTANTGINATKGNVTGKKSTSIKTPSRSRVELGLK